MEGLRTPSGGPQAGRGPSGLALLWERRDECPGAVPIIGCHDEIVVECDTERTSRRRKGLAGEGDDRRDGGSSERHGRGVCTNQDRGRDSQFLGTGIGTGRERQAQTTQSHRILSSSRPSAYTEVAEHGEAKSRFIRIRHSRRDREGQRETPGRGQITVRTSILKGSLGRTRFN